SLNLPDEEDTEMINYNDEDGVWFSLIDIENLIANSFENTEDGCMHFSGTLKFDKKFISSMSNE
ncbi:15667_t:CDS:1, partial [Racocetra fulgida]